MQITISHEPSPASTNGIGVWVRVSLDGEQQPDILDIDEFFQALATRPTGLVPLFTCECGSFGCGGYWIASDVEPEAWIWRNRYHATEETLSAECEQRVPWAASERVAWQLLMTLEELATWYPEAEIFSGTYGADISPRIRDYRRILTGK